jgi:hypothetical protein
LRGDNVHNIKRAILGDAACKPGGKLAVDRGNLQGAPMELFAQRV